MGQSGDYEAVYGSARSFDWDVPDIDLDATSIDEELVRRWPGSDFLAAGWLPVSRDADGCIVVATAIDPATMRGTAEQLLGSCVRIVATDDWSINRALTRVYRTALADDAANALWRRDPAMSARRLLSPAQALTAFVAAVGTVTAIILWPVIALLSLLLLFALVRLGAIVFQFGMGLRGARFDVVEDVTDAEIAALDENELPKYSVMVSVHRRDTDRIADVVASVAALDWPRDRLELLLLLDEDDDPGHSAVRYLRLPAFVKVVDVPVGEPHTATRAANVGLNFCGGELLAAYSAADVPEPGQLKRAYVAFRRAGSRLACVQAVLVDGVVRRRTIGRLLEIAYAGWFDYFLPGLDSAGIPVLLGPSSNHFRVSALRAIHGWDPFSLGVNTDVAMRFAAAGWRTGVVGSTTASPVSTDLDTITRDEGRFLAGGLQSTLVQLRQPLRFARSIGFAPALGYLMAAGVVPLGQLAVLPLAAFFAVVAVAPATRIAMFPEGIVWIVLALFALAEALFGCLGLLALYKRRLFPLAPWVLLSPIYSLVRGVCALRGVAALLLRVPRWWRRG